MLSPEDFHEALRAAGRLLRHPWARTAVATIEPGLTLLFANGREFAVSDECRGLLRSLSHDREMHFGFLEEWLIRKPCLELVTRLYHAGMLLLPDDG